MNPIRLQYFGSINADEFMRMGEKLKELARKVYASTDTEVILGRANN